MLRWVVRVLRMRKMTNIYIIVAWKCEGQRRFLLLFLKYLYCSERLGDISYSCFLHTCSTFISVLFCGVLE